MATYFRGKEHVAGHYGDIGGEPRQVRQHGLVEFSSQF